MSEKFTASNGDVVKLESPKEINVSAGVGARHFMPPVNAVQALREFFQYERDKQLGRWRDTDFQNMVCYPTEHGVTVVNEVTGAAEPWTRAQAGHDWNRDVSGFYTATRYFAAHPESKPWHDAKPGEVWVLTDGLLDRELVCVRSTSGFRRVSRKNVFLDESRITSGRRIWPEES